jgi:hypothetical protein
MSKESNYWKHGFLFLPPLKMTFDVFDINSISLENQKLYIHKLLWWLTNANCHFKNIHTTIFINFLINNISFKFN